LILPLEKLNVAVKFLRRTAGSELRLKSAVVLGTGFAGVADELDTSLEVDYRDIPHFPTTTVTGHPGKLHFGHAAAGQFVLMQGRAHLYEGGGIEPILLPLTVMRELGCSDLVLTNAAGGLDPGMQPGDLMLISDHINMTGMNPLVGPNDDTAGPRFPDMSGLYDANLRKKAKDIAGAQGTSLREGVYLGVTGPSYETPAEARAFRTLGADAVGMSTVLEALYGSYLGMRVLGIACISNVLTGDREDAPTHGSVCDVVSRTVPRLSGLLRSLLGRT
jgi:purine-nucleoside phosphorylase